MFMAEAKKLDVAYNVNLYSLITQPGICANVENFVTRYEIRRYVDTIVTTITNLRLRITR